MSFSSINLPTIKSGGYYIRCSFDQSGQRYLLRPAVAFPYSIASVGQPEIQVCSACSPQPFRFSVSKTDIIQRADFDAGAAARAFIGCIKFLIFYRHRKESPVDRRTFEICSGCTFIRTHRFLARIYSAIFRFSFRFPDNFLSVLFRRTSYMIYNFPA